MKALEALHTFSHVPHRKYTPHTTTLHARSRCLRQQSNLIKILFQTDMTTACVAVGPQSGIVSRPFDYCDTVEKTFFFQNSSIINFKISWTSMYPQFHFPRETFIFQTNLHLLTTSQPIKSDWNGMSTHPSSIVDFMKCDPFIEC